MDEYSRQSAPLLHPLGIMLILETHIPLHLKRPIPSAQLPNDIAGRREEPNGVVVSRRDHIIAVGIFTDRVEVLYVSRGCSLAFERIARDVV